MHSIDPVPLPHDGPSDIALWRIDIDFTMPLDAPAFASLGDDERTRARDFRRHEDALRFAAVRATLREQLARRLGIAAHAVRFALDANHRPHLADSDRFDFNVSHAGAHGLIAISAVRRVGVDIEQHSDKFDWHSIAGLTLDPQEAAWIEGLEAGQQTAAFYDAWVAKEALVKTTGAGISRGLQRLTVLPRDSMRVTLRNQIPDDMREIGAHWLAAPRAYAACLAWSAAAFGR
ncbi:phosphopantetheinyl transferase [Burkholderia sp. Ch1-1]|uniref:4'-phosphopantetheinyl transferase n=1 Tax=Paraburkholderia dioscoreae TaxID=2604047 RepID=A0A5Q4ZPM1_9BURK|nr:MULTISPECIES: 4'-phosphopantetheinyl transferase superfamily protein [Paraburkholderia]EIF35078.1 phosphopantetheinyl transferase [Burkholderia sp. Ch1-1]MDR8396365.1 4'-phosphopantetheinyl transferase superfamily protein [Paraburkholderia sp. USG1]VVD34278.1 4'-phosphopantetheinyl transferase [Paraburkholderia dioscoreae]